MTKTTSVQSPTIIEISREAIIHNFHFFRHLLKDSTQIMAMIKASAYGNGAIEIAKLIEEEKLAEYIGVAYVSEGVELRAAGVELPIMVINPSRDNFKAVVENCLEPEIHHLDQLLAFQTFLEEENLTSLVVIHELYAFAFTFNFCNNGVKRGVKLDLYPLCKYKICRSFLIG